MNRPSGFDSLSVAQLRLFGRVALLQSFSAAARELSLSQPAASRSVASMESAVGGALFLRTTRQVRLTTLGEQLLERLGPMLEEFERLDLLSQRHTRALVGSVRVAAPGAFGRRFVAPAAERFLSENPRTSIELVLTDRRGDLVAQGIDLAVRIGETNLQNARTRVVGRTRAMLVSAPSLLRGRTIRTLADLASLPAVLPLDGGAAVLTALGVRRTGLEVRLKADDVEVLRSAVLHGVGASALPAWLVEDDVRAGRLVELLPDVRLPALPIRLVFASAPKRLTRAFAEAVVDALAAAALSSAR